MDLPDTELARIRAAFTKPNFETLPRVLLERDARFADIAQAPVPTVRSDIDLDKGLAQLRSSKAAAISVVDADGVLIGLLTRENIAEMMMIAQARPDWRFGRAA